jgi:hypothetical protein
VRPGTLLIAPGRGRRGPAACVCGALCHERRESGLTREARVLTAEPQYTHTHTHAAHSDTTNSAYCHGIVLLRVRLLLLPPCEIDLYAPS